MGVHGFTSFMANTYLDRTLEHLHLKNCHLLIDANSLVHKFHRANNLQPFYGGNYDKLLAKLTDLFLLFHKCRIEPIFLFDGSQSPDDRKLHTKLRRAQQRLKEACASLSEHTKKKTISLESLISAGTYPVLNGLLPINALMVCLDLVKAHKFMYYQCTFEADYELACLSNALQCPVLSSDSDFYVYDLQYGYISSDFMELNIERLKGEVNDRMADGMVECYLPVKVYRLENFLAAFNFKRGGERALLQKSMLPIFAVLMGNDFVDSKVFASLMNSFNSTNNNLKFRRLKRNRANQTKQKRSHYDKVLDWLAQYGTAEACLKEILNFVKLDSHDLIRRLVYESNQEYMCLKPSLANHFMKQINSATLTKQNEVDFSVEMEAAVLSTPIYTFAGHKLSAELLTKFCSGAISRYSLDALVHRRLLFVSQIEVADWPSTYLSSQRFRQLYYSILVNRFEQPTDAEPIKIKEYLRYKADIHVYEVDLADRGLHLRTDLMSRDYVYRQLFQLNSQTVQQLLSRDELNESLKQWFATIHFWMGWNDNNNSQFTDLFKVKNDNCKRAFIVSLIKSSIIDVCYKKFADVVAQNHTSDLSNNASHLRSIEDSKEDAFLTNDDYLKDRDFTAKLNEYICSDFVNNEYIKELRTKLVAFTPSLAITHSQVKRTSAYKLGNMFNLRLIHCLCEYQAIHLSLSYLQGGLEAFEPSLRSNTLELLELGCYFNGTFLHNFIGELDRRPCPDLYIEEFFGRKSLFKHVYAKLMDEFDQCFRSERESDTLEQMEM